MRPEPGIYPKATWQEYQEWDAMNWSRFGRLANMTPAEVHHADRFPPEPSQALRFGALVAAMLSGEAANVYCYDKLNWATREGKEQRADIESREASGVLCVPADEWRQAQQAATAAESTKLLPAEREVAIVWDWEGLRCKARLDAIDWQTCTLVDVKTTRTASPDGFAREVVKYNWHAQLAFYLSGCEALSGKDNWQALLVAVQKPPASDKNGLFLAAGYALDLQALVIGECVWQRCLRTYSDCVKYDCWPGYPAGPLPLSLPLWAVRQETERDDGDEL